MTDWVALETIASSNFPVFSYLIQVIFYINCHVIPDSIMSTFRLKLSTKICSKGILKTFIKGEGSIETFERIRVFSKQK